ncbi:hypothetical protein JCM8208_003414 [Rhodotorula glutinis]
MSTDPSPPHPPPPPPPVAATRPSRPPVRLPDEIILDIIDWCNYLSGARPTRLPREREEALAALCHLARRFRPAAQRALYSRFQIGALRTDPILRTLYARPDLRPRVEAVDFRLFEPALDDDEIDDERVAAVLRDLPNVVDVSLRSADAVVRALSTSGLRGPLRRLRVLDPHEEVQSLLRQYEAIVVEFELLHVANIESDPRPGPGPVKLPKLTSLSTSMPCQWASFAAFTSLVRPTLTSLALPLSRELGTYDLAGFSALKSLRLFDPTGTGYGHCRSPSSADLLALLRTCTSASTSPFLTSLALEGDLSRASNPKLDPPFDLVLAALPPSLEHLTLLARNWGGASRAGLADAVSAYLVGEARAPALRSLCIGGGKGVVAERFRELTARRSSGQDGEMMLLVDWLEGEGVQVTTVAESSSSPIESSR